MSYNKLTSLTANVEAIETAVRLFPLNRTASEAEKQILSKYTGFGGIKEVLNIGASQPIPGKMKESFIKLQDLLHTHSMGNEQFYNSMLESIKSSVLTAFYTPVILVQTIAGQIQAAFKNNGLRMKTFLEPSAGIGGFLPVAFPTAYTYAFEKDNVTGMILSALQDNARVIIDGFETIDKQDIDHKTFDVIASNIPFGNFKVFDYDFYNRDSTHAQATKSIHSYFIVKGIDKLNEGGIIAFIAPRGVADAPTNKFLRNYLVHNANMITAIRLPDTLFMQTGGIEVGCDFFIFQKHSHKAVLTSKEQLFLQVTKEAVPDTDCTTEYFNRVFTLPKTMVATTSQIQKNQFGKYVRKYHWQETEATMASYLSDLLKSDIERYFRKGLFESQGKEVKVTQLSLFDSFGTEPTEVKARKDKEKRPYTDKLQWWMKDGAMILFEGQLGRLQCKRIDSFANHTPTFVPLKMQEMNISRASDYFSIRETYLELSSKESEERTEYPQLRKLLTHIALVP
ncbi:N-6 DNA methylase, partial [Bacteroides sp. UBA939]|uniref:N-6 DNA methylase n=1 Tax=Bacteroides sp. UBA939 TaxID=1946092 RepID=UPI0025C0D24A